MPQDVRMNDGTIIKNVPDNISQDELLGMLESAGQDVKKFLAPPAQQETIQPYKKTIMKDSGVDATLNALNASKYDIGGSIAGGIGGGVALGPLGAIAGGIAGGTLGKKADVMAGTREPESTGMQVAKSTGEELAGRVLAPVVKGLADVTGVSKGFNYILNKSGLSRAPKTLDDLMIKQESIDPLEKNLRTIQEAEESLFGGRPLTVFEETQGRAGSSMQALLDERVQSSRISSDLSSDFLKNRDTIVTGITNALKGSSAKSEENLSNAIKQAFVLNRKNAGKQLDVIEKQLVPLRSKVKINSRMDVDGVKTTVDRQLNEAYDYLLSSGSVIQKDLDEIKDIAHKFFYTPAFDKTGKRLAGYIPKETFTMEDIVKFEAEIKNKLPNFNPNKNAQNQLAGAIDANIMSPIFKKRVSAASQIATDKEKAVFDLQSQFDAISRQKGYFENSKLGKAIGATEAKQELSAKDITDLDKSIFSSQQSWKEAQELFDAVGAPELSEAMADRFKANFIKNSFDPKTGEYSFAKMNSLVNKYGEDLIKDIGGEQYLRSIKDAKMVALALDTTKATKLSKPVLKSEQKMMENLRRVMIHPLAGRVALAQGLTTKLRYSLGFGGVSDKKIFQMMQGETGQRLLERSMNSMMYDPATYNVYVQIVRELSKLGADVRVMSRESYYNSVMNGLSEVADNAEQEKQE